MAYDLWGLDITLVAAADLSGNAKQYTFIKLDTNGKAVQCSAATDIPVGVLQSGAASGAPVTVRVLGVTKVQSDAALTASNLIGTSADGQAAAKAAGTDTAQYIVGQMLTTTGAAGNIGTALIDCLAPGRGA